MKSFGTVLKFEIMHYLKNKTFMITSIILVILIAGGLSVPTIVEMFDKEETATEISADNDSDAPKYALLDPEGIVKDIAYLNSKFYLGELVRIDDYEVLESDVLSGKLSGGYVMNNPTTFKYVVLNNEMMDNGVNAFYSAYTKEFQRQGFEEKGLEIEDIESLLQPLLNHEVEILGKDSAANYSYTYILIFGLYFMIIMYGQLIATAVASEKSNRTMELLVTSTKSTYLIFGKVLGGAFAGIVQFTIVIATGKIAYAFNETAWEGDLDFIFKIPADVLLTFSVFGILGYLFFAFIFGALGALVSRVEDVSASVTPITIVFIGVFMIAMLGMQNTEGLVLKIASFVPISSSLTMFVRISMGTVSTIEVAISLVLLAVTTYLIGIFASRIYRMGTLMYGNPVKLKDIPKIMKSQ